MQSIIGKRFITSTGTVYKVLQMCEDGFTVWVEIIRSDYSRKGDVVQWTIGSIYLDSEF